MTLEQQIIELRLELTECLLTCRERAQANAELKRLLATQAERDRALEPCCKEGGKAMCRVLNVRQVGKRPAADRVYVGRPTKWGNPFVIGRDGTREAVIAKYRAWILRQPALMAALPELRGKDLVCWCAPERCHAEVLIELANR